MFDVAIKIVLRPGDLVLQSTDWGWPEELDDLYADLERQDIDYVDRPVTSARSSKGEGTELVLNLANSGAITVALEVLRVWLQERSTRTLTLTIEGPNSVTYDVRGSGVSDETIRAAMLAALERAHNDG